MLGAATQAHDRAEDDFDSNKRMFTTYIEQLLRHYMSIGLLSSELPLAAAVDIVYAINAYDFREFCADEHMTPTNLMVRVRSQLNTLGSNCLPCEHTTRASGHKKELSG